MSRNNTVALLVPTLFLLVFIVPVVAQGRSGVGDDGLRIGAGSGQGRGSGTGRGRACGGRPESIRSSLCGRSSL